MDSILDFFRSLPSDIEYAIERGLDQIQTSCTGDLDVLIRKQDFPSLLQAAESSGLLVSTTVTYGGARIFLGDENTGLKRVDFDWRIHYRGLEQLPVEHYLASRSRDPETGLFALPADQHAAIIYFIKNCYGGADRYRDFLLRHDLDVLDSRQRARMLIGIVARKPLQALAGKMRYILCYLFRFIYPTGLSVSGVSLDTLRASVVAGYLFQDRIVQCGSLASLVRARLLSQLCLTAGTRSSQVAIGADAGVEQIQRAIVDHLRGHRTGLSRLLFAVA